MRFFLFFWLHDGVFVMYTYAWTYIWRDGGTVAVDETSIDNIMIILFKFVHLLSLSLFLHFISILFYVFHSHASTEHRALCWQCHDAIHIMCSNVTPFPYIHQYISSRNSIIIIISNSSSIVSSPSTAFITVVSCLMTRHFSLICFPYSLWCPPPLTHLIPFVTQSAIISGWGSGMMCNSTRNKLFIMSFGIKIVAWFVVLYWKLSHLTGIIIKSTSPAIKYTRRRIRRYDA